MPDFTIYRLSDDEADISRFIQLTEGADVETSGPVNVANFAAHLFVDRPFRRRPPWAQFIEDGFPGALDWHPSRSLGALMVIQVASAGTVQSFAFAYGQTGRYLLRDDAYKRRYGLKAALNLMSDPDRPPRLRAFDTTRHGQNILRSRVQTTSASGVEVFELDLLRDLVRSATGEPIDNHWGSRVGGADALQITGHLRFEELGDFCLDVEDMANRTAYKE